jgi:O-antigen ligase
MKNKFVEFLIYATIFLLPTYLIRFSIFGIPTNMLEILMLAVLISWIIFLKPGFREFAKFGFEKNILFCLIFIFFGLLFSVLLNKNYMTGFGIIKGWFVLPFLFSLTVAASIPRKKRLSIFYAYYLSATTASFLGIICFFLNKVTFDGRLEIFFNSPNYLAMYLAPGILSGLYFWKKTGRETKKIKAIYIISFLSLLVSFYLTYSYAAWMAVIISILIVELIKWKNKFNFSKIFAVTLIMLLIFLFQWNGQKMKAFRTLDERSSIESRIMIWKTSVKILENNLFWGIGPGNFQQKYLEYQKYFLPYLEWAVPHPHNLYLTFWLSGGILSFIGFLTLIFFWFQKAIKNERNSLWAVSFTIMLYFLFHGLTDTTYFKNDLAVIFWLNFLLAL